MNLSFVSANASANAVAALASGGFLDIYSGTIPGTPETAAAGTLLVSIPLPTPAFGSAVNGVASLGVTLNATTSAGGTAAWFRVYMSNHTTALWDGSVGTGSGDLVVDTTTFLASKTIAITSLTYTQPGL